MKKDEDPNEEFGLCRVAYMQEVGGFLGGEHDYTKLKGDTGPLVLIFCSFLNSVYSI